MNVDGFKAAFDKRAEQEPSGRDRIWRGFGTDQGGGDEETDEAGSPSDDDDDLRDAVRELGGEVRAKLRDLDKMIGLMTKTGVDEKAIAEIRKTHDTYDEFVDNITKYMTDPSATHDNLERAAEMVEHMIGRARQLAKARPISVSTGPGQSEKVFWSDLGGYEVYEERSRDLGAQTVGFKIRDGKQMLDRLSDDGDIPEPTPKDATNLIWALKTQAQEGSGDTLALPDSPGLRRYLERCQDSVFPKGAGAGSLDLWGCDVRDGHEQKLPAGLGGIEFETVRGEDGKSQLVIRFKSDAKDLAGGDEPTQHPTGPIDVLRRGAETCARLLAAGPLEETVANGLLDQANGLVASAPDALKAPLKLALAGSTKLPAFVASLATLSADEQTAPLFGPGSIRPFTAFLARVRRAASTRPPPGSPE